MNRIQTIRNHILFSGQKKRVHIVAMGDVGTTIAIGLKLCGADCIHTIGVYDTNKDMVARCMMELNQITLPFDLDALPAVGEIDDETLFDCDVFVFTASRSVPPVGEGGDVRMAQLAGNARIVEHYARLARERLFSGLFAVVSDPVDLLCQCAYYTSNRTDAGAFDGKGLCAEQIRGFGLGVMHARAAYYAKKDARFASYLTEGRAFGPHGQALVIANSITHYDDALSLELTQRTVNANKDVRALGFKPYIAPALSSGAFPLLLTMRGEWHYSAIFEDDIYFGRKNRQTAHGIEVEELPVPDALMERLDAARETLRKEGARWKP
ncbi:hypothetical protein LJC07_01910 [Christensenellaceae bacterium OttesenSCG-928-L17]|nr:hypothetical protein [Christensenellaceae bacterium OttesenSCG-928-L17]